MSVARPSSPPREAPPPFERVRAPLAFAPVAQPAPIATSRNYQGARRGGRNTGWVVSNDDANSLLGADNTTLRARARDLVRNNHHAAGAVETFVNEVVGTGIRPTSATGDDRIDTLVDTIWEEFAEQSVPDGSGTWYTQQFATVFQVFEVGESLARFRGRRPEDGLSVPLQVELLEVDHLDESQDGPIVQGRTVMGQRVLGIEFDAIGRRSAYRLFRSHPGARVGWTADTTTVPASDMLHVYRWTRPGQVRGVTRLAPVVQALQDLGDGADAERVRRKLEACMFAFVMDNTPELANDRNDGVAPATVSDRHGNPLERFLPGMIMHVHGDKRIEKVTPASVGGYREYKQTELEGVAAGIGMPYPMFSGDLSAVNFSSGRMGNMKFRAAVQCFHQLFLIPQFCAPTWKRFIAACIVSGRLPFRRDGYPVQWTTPLPQEVDREASAQADAVEIGNRTRSRSDVIRGQGRNPKRVFAEIAREEGELQALGLLVAPPSPAAPAAPSAAAVARLLSRALSKTDER